ncbi:MAG TPA: PilC/PilY family type IV pilus protein [Methylophilaceae bacterium]|jgi:type IV pilus assembly protein PilY1
MFKWGLPGVFLLGKTITAFAVTSLADSPVLAVSAGIPGNVALVLSVEYPTALGSAYTTNYDITQEYLGYFDANKCYSYLASTASDGSYFIPQVTTTGHDCSAKTAGRWSGNFLNWALTQTIDPFRATLTGGYRAVDKDGLTVLEKAWAIGPNAAANPALTDAPTITKSTPFSLSTLNIRINGLGNKFYFTSTGDNYNPGTVQADSTVTANPTANKVYQMYARVQACKSGVLESNCAMYQNGDYKPTGLIQQNALKLNFAAFGYLNDSDIKRDGGVLRAKMAPLGPVKSVGSTTVTNANAEWDSSTGIFAQNPDPTDATTSGVSNSGVINYLNKFGLTAPGYKSYDPVSELYYTASRYFRNKGNVPAYTSSANSTMVDGFPVITTWDDPIKYSCQSNFIIGIGDTNTHADANLPGSTIRSSNEPSLPTEVSNDNSTLYGSVDTATNTDNLTDVKKSTNQIGNMEGLGNLGQQYTPWCCNNNTFFMAGIAYDIHTTDIRPDFTGSQTVTTYWLDVLESGDRKDYGSTGMRNQFWLTAKYGGFTVPSGFTPYPATAVPLTKSQWDTDVNGTTNDDPDNYFRANNPALMKSGLTNAFSSIVNAVNGSSISFATSSPAIQSGTLTYASGYSSAGWTGDVVAKQVNIDANGLISTSNPVWNAAPQLDSKASGTGWDGARVIATTSTQASGCVTTSNTANGVSATMLQNSCGVPFRLGNLSAAQKTALTAVSANQQSLLNFLRGDRSDAGNLGTKLYRDRATILGDIVNSKAVPEGPPSMPYLDLFNPGYSSFKTTYKNRPTVVYVGANDGMLHAFNGSATGGNELFAYVPNALFLGPNNTPATDGLAQLASTSYIHHYYVDATPQVADVNFGGGVNDWHTLLVGGLGKGGKSYFAIDVTDPATLNSEANLAAAVKWEFSHPLMGYTYDTPLIVKTVKYGWVVVLTSGYNNSDGQGYIFIVNPKTGALLENPIATGAGSVANDAGLAHVNGFVGDARSGIADALYAGDLLGNLWRVDLTGTTGNYSALKIAILSTDASGSNRQPVTTSPVAEVDVSTGKRYVFVGTGKFLDSTDLNSTQAQTFYAINDGTLSSFYTSATLPAAAGVFPITKAKMVNGTSSILTGITANSATPMGYYIDLGINPSNGKTNFINTEMASAAGTISFIANSVNNTNTCNPVGSNLTYALSYGTGQTTLTDSNGNLIQNISGAGLGQSLNFVQSTFLDSTGATQTGVKLIKCDDQGNCVVLNPKVSSTKPFTQLNWRELPTAD